jgi:hypothetical protein
MQGTIVDRIDYNIQSVATTVEEGFKQLQKVLFGFLLLAQLNTSIVETLLSLRKLVYLLTFVSDIFSFYKLVINLLKRLFTYRRKERRKKGG